MNMKKNNTDKAFSKKLISEFSASLDLDKRLYKEDIQLSIAYSKALKKIGILSNSEQRSIEKALKKIYQDIKKDKFEWRMDLEDIHMNIESRLHDMAHLRPSRLQQEQELLQVGHLSLSFVWIAHLGFV